MTNQNESESSLAVGLERIGSDCISRSEKSISQSTRDARHAEVKQTRFITKLGELATS